MSATLVVGAHEIELEPSGINPSWIVEGSPKTRVKHLATSQDGTESIFAWDCTAGRFHWHYSLDETCLITSGEAFLTFEKEERRIGAGDMVHFHAGSSCLWRVPAHIRKIAVLRQTIPFPVRFLVRAFNKIKRLRKGGALALAATPLTQNLLGFALDKMELAEQLNIWA